MITFNGSEVTMDELKKLLDVGTNVRLIDGGATVAAWSEVIDVLNELDCNFETD